MKERKIISKTTITILDFRGGKEEEVELRDICEEKTQQLQAAMEKSYGIVYEIKRIVNPELFIKAYYERNGYIVMRGTEVCFLDKYDAEDKQILKTLTEKFKVDTNIRVGCPDYFVYKEDNLEECFFVEVKAGRDTLSPAQLRWVSKNIAPIKIIYVTSELEKGNKEAAHQCWKDSKIEEKIAPILMFIKTLQDEAGELVQKGDLAGSDEIYNTLKDIRRWL